MFKLGHGMLKCLCFNEKCYYTCSTVRCAGCIVIVILTGNMFARTWEHNADLTYVKWLWTVKVDHSCNFLGKDYI